jgi:membrane-associated phospholipid phosphatase
VTHRIRVTVVGVSLALCLGGANAPAIAQTLGSESFAPAAVLVPASERQSPFRNLFTDTVADFRRLPSLETVVILSVGGLGAFAGHAADTGVTRVLAGSEEWGERLSAGKTLGGMRAQMAGALATYALGKITRNSKVSAVGADLVSAQLLAQTLTGAVKFSVGRTRPDGTQYSFPSGHASTTFATATVLQRNLGWKVGIPAYGLAGYVAASRIQSKRHFLSDVTFGAAIGIVAGRAATVGRGNARFAIAPAATDGGAAVNFTWIGRK